VTHEKNENIDQLRGLLAHARTFDRCVDFLMVIMASGIARGRVRTTTAATTGLKNR